MDKNGEKLAAAEERGKLPYFLQDNSRFWKADDSARAARIEAARLRQAARTPEQVADIKARWAERIKKNSKTQLLTEYETNKQVNETFKKINGTPGNEWFENGDLEINATSRVGVNGYTYRNGRIYLKTDRLENVKSALSKIGSGVAKKMTKDEADAMATFWHEITHNRNIITSESDKTQTQTRYMEMMNEFVARKTLSVFYRTLGSIKPPHPEFRNIRESTGYDQMVRNHDFVVKKLKLKRKKVVQSAKKSLFNTSYAKQKETAIQALLDGGLNDFTLTDGKKLKESVVKKIVEECIGVFTTTTAMEEILKKYKLIK